jgi:hypothetical protein
MLHTDLQGISYVAWPRLNAPYEILSYAGPGFKGKQRGRGMSLGSALPLKRSHKSSKSKSGRFEDIELKKKGALID